MEFLKSLMSTKALIAALLIIVLVLRPFVMYTAVKDSEDKDAQTLANMYIAIGSMSILAVAIIMFMMKTGVKTEGAQKYLPMVVMGLVALSMILQITNLSMLKAGDAGELTFNATLDLLSTVYVALLVYGLTMTSAASSAATAAAATAAADNTAFGHFYY